MNKITMSQFGHMGRFGNQLFQYAFLKLYAAKYNLQLELPPWVGQQLFGCTDPPITTRLPPKQEVWRGAGGHLDEHIPPEGDEFIGCDWHGYAQYHTSYYEPHASEFCSFFQPTPEVVAPLHNALARLKASGKSVIGIHYRAGDFGQLSFHLTPFEWYANWLRENIRRFDEPVLFIAAEDRRIVDQFAPYAPVVTAEELGVTMSSEPLENCVYLAKDAKDKQPHIMDFFSDWWLLSKCDVIVGSNSTFSFTAAMLNDGLLEYWRSSLPAAGFEAIDPWNARPFRTERVEDYPELEGIRCVENPYW